MKKTLMSAIWLTLIVILTSAWTFVTSDYTLTTLYHNIVHANGINNSCQISGFFRNGGYHGFINYGTGDSFSIIDLPGHSGRTWVYGINDLVQVVGNTDGSSFIDTGGSFTPLNVPSDWNGNNTAARGINNSGQVVGYYTSTVYDYQDHGFLYESSTGSFTKVVGPDGTRLLPSGINNSGQVVGSYSGFHTSGFIKTGENFTTLMVPGSSNTYALGINNIGQVVGYYNKDYSDHGFIYTGGNYITLEVQGALSTYLTGINDSGQVVGYFDSMSYSDMCSFLGNPVKKPIPPHLLLLLY